MTQCLLFVLPVQTATEIDGAGRVQHGSKEGVVCAPKHGHMRGGEKKAEADKVKSFYREMRKTETEALKSEKVFLTERISKQL